MNNNQKLGIKVFYYYLSRKISLGIFALIVSIIVASYKSVLISKVVSLAPMMDIASVIVTYFIYILFILSAGLLISALIMSWINYISCDFTLDENAFNIRRGLFTKKEVSIPYRQIQNVNIEQTLSQKIIGIGKLVVLTDGDRDNEMLIPEGVFEVIDYDLAHKIRQFILERTNLQVVKDAEPKVVVGLN